MTLNRDEIQKCIDALEQCDAEYNSDSHKLVNKLRTEARPKSSWKIAGLRVFAVATSLASIAFMGLTFYTEHFLGRGQLFVEPNPLISGAELLTTVLAFLAVCYLFARDI